MKINCFSCNSIGCTAVKCTACFALVTLCHTLLVLNGKGLLLRDYLSHSFYFGSGAWSLNEQTLYEDHSILDKKDTMDAQHHLQFLKEDEQDIVTKKTTGTKHSTQVIDGPPILSPKRPFSLLGEKEITTVKKFVFFVGYSRSGHSIVASLLDAHPNVIIAHEYNMFRKWKSSRYQNRPFLYNELYRNSYYNAERGWRSSMKSQKGYTLAVKGSWQGSFDELSVIGEKSGAVTAQTYGNDPWLFMQTLEELKHTVEVPIRVIHVVRNPYDMISTRLLYADGKTHKYKVRATVDVKHTSPHNLSMQVNRTIHVIQNVQELLHNCSLNSIEIHTADLVRDPEHVMENLCMFLGIECSQDYLRKCSDKVFERQSQTRQLVEWPEELVDKVYQMIIKPYQPFWRYSFNSS